MTKSVLETSGAKTLKDKILEVTAYRAKLAKSLEDTNMRIETLKKTRDLLETELRAKQAELEEFHELAIIESPLHPDILRTVSRLLGARKKSESRNITIARKEELECRITDLLALLQSICPHTFLLSYDGYAGSYINEHSDAYPGMRKCIVCEKTEISGSTSEDKYKILTAKEERLIKRDIRRTDKHRIAPERQGYETVEYYLEAFRRSAGDININWPVVKNGVVTEESDCFLRV